MSNKPQIVIREATEADGPALHALHVEALRRHPEAFAADAERTQGDQPAWIWRLRRNLSEGMGTICLAEVPAPEGHGRQPVAMSGIYRRTLRRMQHTATVWGCYVRPAWRNHGLGGRLLEVCADWAARHDVRLMRLAVVADNTAAIRCYSRHGFRVYGVEPEALFYDGAYHDELLMVRRVSGGKE
ncbi:MAG: GNAT family N-acetyltransferase [Candidatus Promineifilaceae bacterium]|nr:GNAT family N-acetyltransferase [Candidatus Promineifilaceae bacterium]